MQKIWNQFKRLSRPTAYFVLLNFLDNYQFCLDKNFCELWCKTKMNQRNYDL